MTRVTSLLVCLCALVASAAAPTPRPTVSVLYFDVSHPDPNVQLFKKAFAQMMITDLIANPAIQVVERERLEEVMAELKLQATRAFDQATTVKLGGMQGAKYQVTGQILMMPNGKDVLFQARVIELQQNANPTSRGALRFKGTVDDVLDAEQKLSELVAQTIATAEASGPPAAPPKRGTRLKLETGVKYAQALDALDKKDKVTAKARLQEVVKEQPDFVLASLDLDKLVK